MSLREAAVPAVAAQLGDPIRRLRRWPLGAAAWSLLWIVGTLAMFRHSAVAAASMAGLLCALQRPHSGPPSS